MMKYSLLIILLIACMSDAFAGRYFSAEQGRFISRDSLGYVDGPNLYSAYFVPNHMDPTGMNKCKMHVVFVLVEEVTKVRMASPIMNSLIITPALPKVDGDADPGLNIDAKYMKRVVNYAISKVRKAGCCIESITWVQHSGSSELFMGPAAAMTWGLSQDMQSMLNALKKEKCDKDTSLTFISCGFDKEAPRTEKTDEKRIKIVNKVHEKWDGPVKAPLGNGKFGFLGFGAEGDEWATAGD